MDSQEWDSYKKFGKESLTRWIADGSPGFQSSVNLVSGGVPIMSFQSPFNGMVPMVEQMVWSLYLSRVNADTAAVYMDSYMMTGPGTGVDDYARGDLGKRFQDGDPSVSETLMVRGVHRDSAGVRAFGLPYRRVTSGGVESRFSDGSPVSAVEFLSDLDMDLNDMVEDRYADMLEILVSGSSGREPVPDHGVEFLIESAEFLGIKKTPDTEWLISRLSLREFAPQVYGWSEFGPHPSLGLVFQG